MAIRENLEKLALERGGACSAEEAVWLVSRARAALGGLQEAEEIEAILRATEELCAMREMDLSVVSVLSGAAAVYREAGREAVRRLLAQ